MKILETLALMTALAVASPAADEPSAAPPKPPATRKPQLARTAPALPKSPEKWIGVMAGPPPDMVRAQLSNLPEGQGLIIFNIAKESPAVVAGLEKFDIILRADSQPVGTPQDLQQVLNRRNFGTQMRLDIQRKGQAKQVYAIVLEKPEGEPEGGGLGRGGPFGSPNFKPENVSIQFSFIDANGDKQTLSAPTIAELGQKAQKEEEFRNKLQKMFQNFPQHKDGITIHLKTATPPAGAGSSTPPNP